jgi:hypothetical protein
MVFMPKFKKWKRKRNVDALIAKIKEISKSTTQYGKSM